jgi:hypothetical protein
VDAFLVHVVYGIAATTTYTNYFNDARGCRWEIERHYIVFF